MSSRASPFAPSPRPQRVPPANAPPSSLQRPVPGVSRIQERYAQDDYRTVEKRLRSVGLPDNSLAYRNVFCISEIDFPNAAYVLVNNVYAMACISHQKISPGEIGIGGIQREWCRLSMGESVSVSAWDPFATAGEKMSYLSSMDIEVGFLQKAKQTADQFDPEQLQEQLCRLFESQVFAPQQLFIFDLRGFIVRAQVKAISLIDTAFDNADSVTSSDTKDRGILSRQTQIEFFKSSQQPLNIKASKRRAPVNAIIQPSFKFEDMGIGGLDKEISSIFRRAFASRILPLGLCQRMELQHVKGILMFGPPGTGKTLIARQIGKMLNANEPKIVNGPEILNKFVGQSEENIRKLFADAEKEFKEKGDESSLHIIIFDELDAICKQRGSTGGGTGVGDSVVNQLLSKMDGVDQLNNILVIGMTNRKDMIDDALLRPGRLEVHIEIHLPDEHGRVQILDIQTAHMKRNNILGPDVDIRELARLTKNYSGAELSGVVRSANSFAINSYLKVGTVAEFDKSIEDMQISMANFVDATEEVRPAFGVSEEELESMVQSGIFHFSPRINDILRQGQLYVNEVRQAERTPLVSVLLYGPRGAGKSALAATIAMKSDFAFVRLVSPESMIGMSEQQKVGIINKVFTDSTKSQTSCIVVDNIERIIDWVPIGPRFSNTVLQSLMVLFQRKPPPGKRLLILATTSQRSICSQLGFLDAFDGEIPVPEVSDIQQLQQLVQDLDLFPNSRMLGSVINSIQDLTGSTQVNVGVKRVIFIGEAARQDEDVGGRFVDLMAEAISANAERL